MDLERKKNDILGNGDSVAGLTKGSSMTISTAGIASSVVATISPDGASSTSASASASGTPTPPDAILDKTWVAAEKRWAVAYDNIGGWYS